MMVNKTTLDQAKMLIEAERAHQDSRWGTTHDHGHTPQEWRDLIALYMAKALETPPTPPDFVEFGRRLTQVAGLGCVIADMLESAREALSKFPPGATWFMRCKDCEEMYVASQGWSMTTGKQNVYWVRPRPIRQPKKCRHEGTVQHWNGEAWVDMSALGSPTP
jgi:hypothetical protein